jgi:putative transposase
VLYHSRLIMIDSMKHRVVKVRLYPNSQQKTALAKAFGCTRWLWNNSLNETNRLFKETGKGLSAATMKARIVELKKEYPWLTEVYSQVLQSAVLNLSQAFVNFFQKRTQYPRFKSKHGRQSIQYPQHVKLLNKRISLPKVGEVKADFHTRYAASACRYRMYEGKLKTVTVSLNPSGEYYASLLFEVDGVDPVPFTEGKAIGIDLGINHFAVTSDGSKFDNPRTLAKYEHNLKRKQRKLSRKQKGSNRRKKAKQLVAKVHQHIANVRKDFLHKLSRRLVNENQVIAVESLNVKGMVRNHNLAKAISDCGWSTFVGMLKYKCEWEGKVLMQVDRFFPSSQTCSECLYQIGEMPLDIRAWTCPSCGIHHDRDINAAKNIVAEALKLLASGTGATASGGSVRPKPGRKSSVAATPGETGRHASIS